MSELWTGWNSLSWLGLFIALGAGVVRGFAGVGFSALVVAGLSLFMAPAPVVPAVLILEIFASLFSWRTSVRQLDARWFKALLTGNLVFIPVGVYLLAFLDGVLLRLVVALALLLTAAGLRWRGAMPMAPSPVMKGTAGVLSGFLNGLAASGGVAAGMLMAACHVPALAMRGVMVAILMFGSAYTLLWAGIFSYQGGTGVDLLSLETIRWIVALGPGMLLGMWLGHKAFARSNPASFHRLMLNLLIFISVLGATRAGIELLMR